MKISKSVINQKETTVCYYSQPLKKGYAEQG